MADREQQLEVIRLADALVTQHSVPREKALRAAAERVGVSLERTPVEQAAEDARLEKTIVRDADKQMRALGFIVVNFSQPRASKQTPGIPDREYFHRDRGLFLKWEAKTPHGEQSPDQIDYQRWCNDCGVIYICGTDETLYSWLIIHRIAFEEGGLLVPLPYERTERSA